MATITERRGTFRARDEAGAAHVIHRYEVLGQPTSQPLLIDERDGLVRRLDRGQYELAGPLPLQLRSDDPKAP